ncbi:uncharacterized protein B0T15DRAFT_535195 [Chaetomium strumarium]|uniref:Leucine rich repeat domain-containing protein n=1 Tax=Chaetomium strumarium TaxID=1170767 RepID=A0AAJ0M016_9PEZI|nr:hypothetical protein B0T15DRAFT_535195 [Chaetomium strumarium]
MSDRHADPEWCHRFLEHTVRVRAETLALVTCLDLRRFTAITSDFPLYSGCKSLSAAFRSLPSTFSRLRCILLDGHLSAESQALVDSLASARALPPSLNPPLLLSIPRCPSEQSPSFFASPYLTSLVYLDVSDLPGSLKTALVQRKLSPANLPSLRILKAQGREIDDAVASLLFKVFKQQLWSVNLSRNKLTDAVFVGMHEFSFPAQSSRAGDPAVEGRLSYSSDGSISFGKFCFVKESDWSTAFSHPHRYLADAPFYTTHEHTCSEESLHPRLNGRAKIRPDSADAIRRILSGDVGSHSPPLEHIHGLDICRDHQGITHLHLNDNNISAAGLARMIRSSPGQLQYLECDTMSFKLPTAAPFSWLSNTKLSGILGSAHVFRPLFSANLQVLRIHHSLVTQLLSLELDGQSPMANLWLAETDVLPRAELAYPEAFVPDMNPRLQCLVLTRIPRYSTGPLIDKLIAFLKLASIQEGAIQEVRVSTSRRGPATLLGLCHIRLEFDADPSGDLADDSDFELLLDPATVMDDSSKEFSFFGDSHWAPSPATTAQPPLPSTSARENQSPASTAKASQSAQPGSPPAGPDPSHLMYTWTWNGQTCTLPIWIGSTTASTTPTTTSHPNNNSHTPAVAEYMRLLRAHPDLRTGPVPASPCHVAAGVPSGSYIFSAAWDAMLAPTPPTPPTTTTSSSSSSSSSPPKPTGAELRGMRDVVAAIKGYRAQTRRAYEEVTREARLRGEAGREVNLGEPHFHWMGRLEVMLVEDPMTRYHASRYWR